MDGPSDGADSRALREAADIREKLRAFFIASRLTRRRVLPFVVVAVNLAAYAAVQAFAPRTARGELHPLALLFAGAKVNELVLAGEWWRLVASVFLHADGTHLAVNAIGAFFMVQLADNVFGPARTVALYALAGVLGAVASLAFAEAPSLGASGAVFGLLGAVTTFAITRRRLLPAPLRRAMLGSTAAWVVVSLAYGAGSENVDNAAHVGGLVAGMVLALTAGRDLPVFHAVAPPPFWPGRVAAAVSVVAVAWAASHSARGLALDFDLPPSRLATLDVAGVTVPYPADWKPGAAETVEGGKLACRMSDELFASAAADLRPTCLRDAYGTLLIVGRAGDLVPGLTFDPSMTLQYGLRRPTEVRRDEVTRRVLMLNRDVVLVLVGFADIAAKYDGMLDAILDGVRFARRP
jgi:membrane associated rhomboid family serine protease